MVFRNDLCGLACVVVTYICIGYVDYAVTVLMIGGSLSYSVFGMLNIAVFNIVVILMLLSHARAMTCDPGIVSNLPNNRTDFNLVQSEKYKQQEGGSGWTICSKCDAVRPPLAHHCRICGRCVKKMDHHCPWINNCIGEVNQKYLLMFLFYVVLASLYAMSMVATYWFLHPTKLDKAVISTQKMHTGIICSMATLFSLFAVAVSYDQLLLIRVYGEKAAMAKGESLRTQMSVKEACYEVFGDIHPFLWMLPLNLNRRRNSTRQGLLAS